MTTSILVTNSANTMIVTKAENIFQRSKMAHQIVIYIVNKYLDKYDTAQATVSLEVLAPNGKRQSVQLEPEPVVTKPGYLNYIYMLDSELTTADGTIQLGMSITYVNPDNGDVVIREIGGCELTILPIAQWTTQIDDDNLTDLQNKIVELNKIATAIISGNAGTGIVTDIAVGMDDEGMANLHLVNAAGDQVGNGLSVADNAADLSDGSANAEIDLSKILEDAANE